MSFFKKIFPIILLAGLLLIFFWPSLTGGTFISTGMIYSDLMSFNYPIKDLYRNLLLNGRLPFWTSLIGSGYPLFAEGQLGALYPIHLVLFRFLPTLLAFNLNLYLHFLLAAVFTYLFCRISLKRSIPASILAGLAYCFSGFFMTHLHQVNIILEISYLPLLLFLVERLVSTKKYYWGLVISLVFSLQILAGYIQLFYYTGLITFVFFILLAFIFPQGDKKPNSRLFLFLIIAAILGVAITAVQVLPTWELTKLSQRQEGLNFEASTGVVWPIQALSLFINPKAYDVYLPTPDFHPLNPDSINYNVIYGYIGIIPLLLALLGILSGRKNRYVVIFAIFLFGAFIFGMGSITQLFTILWTIIPGMNYFREPVKILFLIEFSLAVLASFGLDLILNKWGRLKMLGWLVILITFLDLYINNGLAIQPIISGREWFRQPETAGFLKKELENNSFRYYSCGTGNLDYGLVKDLKIQKELQNTLLANYNLLYQIPSSQEWVGLFLGPMMDLNSRGIGIDVNNKVLRIPAGVKRSLRLQNVRYYICNLPIDDPELILRKTIPLSKTINQITFLSGPQGVQKAVLPTKETYIYEDKNSLPRAWLVIKNKTMGDRKQVLETIFSENFDPRKEVILDEISNTEPETDKNNYLVKIKKDIEEELELEVKTDQPGFLVLSDAYYPGWKATVDGQPTKIYRADYAYRAVSVNAGNHLIKFSYEPTYLKIGLIISGITTALVFIALSFSLIKKK